MVRRIVIASQKGGVGKTTVALHLALSLAERGRPTLLVDLDPQGGIGLSLGRSDVALAGLADLLMGQATASEVVLYTKMPGLAIVPRGRLDPVDAAEFEVAMRSKEVLEGVLSEVESPFSYVILDTPSGLGMITRGALAVAHEVLLPAQASALAMRSLSQATRVIDHVRATENPALSLLGFVATMVERDKDTSQDVLVDMWNQVPGVLDTIIPRADVFAKASRAGLPIGFLGGKPSPEVRRFDALAAEIEAILEARGPNVDSDVERPERQLL